MVSPAGGMVLAIFSCTGANAACQLNAIACAMGTQYPSETRLSISARASTL